MKISLKEGLSHGSRQPQDGQQSLKERVRKPESVREFKGMFCPAPERKRQEKRKGIVLSLGIRTQKGWQM